MDMNEKISLILMQIMGYLINRFVIKKFLKKIQSLRKKRKEAKKLRKHLQELDMSELVRQSKMFAVIYEIDPAEAFLYVVNHHLLEKSDIDIS